jgi:hypothetical protein
MILVLKVGVRVMLNNDRLGNTRVILDSTLTLDRITLALRYEIETFTKRYSTQVWCVFTSMSRGIYRVPRSVMW